MVYRLKGQFYCFITASNRKRGKGGASKKMDVEIYVDIMTGETNLACWHGHSFIDQFVHPLVREGRGKGVGREIVF